jgi:hypothetical protein
VTAKRSNVVPFRRRPRPPLGPGTKQDPIVVLPPRLAPMAEGEQLSGTAIPTPVAGIIRHQITEHDAAKMLRVMAGYLSSFGPPHPLTDVRHVAGAVAEAVDSDLALRGRSFAELVTGKARRLMT